MPAEVDGRHDHRREVDGQHPAEPAQAVVARHQEDEGGEPDVQAGEGAQAHEGVGRRRVGQERRPLDEVLDLGVGDRRVP